MRPCPKCNGTGQEIDQVAFGAELRSIREKHGVSLRKVALAMKISPPYLSDLEAGNRHWNSDLIARFKAALKEAIVK